MPDFRFNRWNPIREPDPRFRINTVSPTIYNPTSSTAVRDPNSPQYGHTVNPNYRPPQRQPDMGPKPPKDKRQKQAQWNYATKEWGPGTLPLRVGTTPDPNITPRYSYPMSSFDFAYPDRVQWEEEKIKEEKKKIRKAAEASRRNRGLIITGIR